MGLAIYKANIILPLPTLKRINLIQALNDLNIILKERNIKTIIVGFNDSLAPNIKYFLSQLNFSGDVIFISEELTSKEAYQDLKDLKQRGAKFNVKRNLDAMSASIILERYLSSINR